MRTGFSALAAIPLLFCAETAFSGEFHGFAGANGLPSVTPWGDTYAGSISTVTLPGNGTFFHVKKTAPAVKEASASRIRTVSAATSDCAWEAGVCVIRRK